MPRLASALVVIGALAACQTTPPTPTAPLPPPVGRVGDQQACAKPLCTPILTRADAERVGVPALLGVDYTTHYVLRIGTGGSGVLFAGLAADAEDVVVVDVPTDLPCGSDAGAGGSLVRVPRDPRPLLIQPYKACGIVPVAPK